jgi:uroporphyrinogen decarboxylase
VEGGGSKEFMGIRGACRRDPEGARAALEALATAMNDYLRFQAGAGVDVVQLFDTWAGWFDRDVFQALAVPSARASLIGVGVPTIYFAPGAGHTLDLQAAIGAAGYGVDWREPLDVAWARLGDVAVQGNLDPAVLLSDPGTITFAVDALLRSAAGRPGHIVNLGHGIDRHTPPAHVAALVEAVHSWR